MELRNCPLPSKKRLVWRAPIVVCRILRAEIERGGGIKIKLVLSLLLFQSFSTMSDAEENKPAEGSEPITIRVRDQVSVTIKKQQRNAVAALVTGKSGIAC